MTEELDITQMIIDYEQGELSLEGQIRLFAELIKSGLAWQLQGNYGRTAQSFIKSSIINRRGEIDWDAFNDVYDGE